RKVLAEGKLAALLEGSPRPNEHEEGGRERCVLPNRDLVSGWDAREQSLVVRAVPGLIEVEVLVKSRFIQIRKYQNTPAQQRGAVLIAAARRGEAPIVLVRIVQQGEGDGFEFPLRLEAVDIGVEQFPGSQAPPGEAEPQGKGHYSGGPPASYEEGPV